MQTLRDAAILLGLLIVLTSVRVTRVEPGPAALDLVPAAHAGVAAGAVDAPQPASLPGAAPAGPVAPQPAAADGCTSIKVLRVERISIDTQDLGRGAVAVTVDSQTANRRAPGACKIG